MDMTISEASYNDLVAYLESHEHDIASGMNDFDLLQHLFFDVMGREAEE